MSGIEFMHQLFGSGNPSDKCGTCDHLVSYKQSRTWYKCEVYGDTRSEATDWRLKYPSCALYNMPYNGTTGIEIEKHMRKPKEEVQCDGQMSLFDKVEK